MMDRQQQNIDVYDRHVEQYIDRFMDLALYKATFEYLVSRLPARATVLELGCGPGNVIKYLSGRRPDLVFLGIDLSPAMIEAARRENPGVEFRVMDIRRAGEIGNTFDAVITSFCIPYIARQELATVFDQLRSLTRTGSLVYLSFMEGDAGRSGFEKTSFTGDYEMYIEYYSRSEVESLFVSRGFRICSLHEQDYAEADGCVTKDLVYVAERE